MRKNFCFETNLHKLFIASVTRMLPVLGEGELEIKSQGRFWYSLSFSQETEANGQQAPRNGERRPKLDRELSARKRVGSDSTPHFFFLPQGAIEVTSV